MDEVNENAKNNLQLIALKGDNNGIAAPIASSASSSIIHHNYLTK
jgi:hypothetical protein